MQYVKSEQNLWACCNWIDVNPGKETWNEFDWYECDTSDFSNGNQSKSVEWRYTILTHSIQLGPSPTHTKSIKSDILARGKSWMVKGIDLVQCHHLYVTLHRCYKCVAMERMEFIVNLFIWMKDFLLCLTRSMFTLVQWATYLVHILGVCVCVSYVQFSRWLCRPHNNLSAKCFVCMCWWKQLTPYDQLLFGILPEMCSFNIDLCCVCRVDRMSRKNITSDMWRGEISRSSK